MSLRKIGGIQKQGQSKSSSHHINLHCTLGYFPLHVRTYVTPKESKSINLKILLRTQGYQQRIEMPEHRGSLNKKMIFLGPHETSPLEKRRQPRDADLPDMSDFSIKILFRSTQLVWVTNWKGIMIGMLSTGLKWFGRNCKRLISGSMHKLSVCFQCFYHNAKLIKPTKFDIIGKLFQR